MFVVEGKLMKGMERVSGRLLNYLLSYSWYDLAIFLVKYPAKFHKEGYLLYLNEVWSYYIRSTC